MKAFLPCNLGLKLVSIPLPGFIVMKVELLIEAFWRLCFNPVAGIHCNESPGSATRRSTADVSIPLPGFIVMKAIAQR